MGAWVVRSVYSRRGAVVEMFFAAVLVVGLVVAFGVLIFGSGRL